MKLSRTQIEVLRTLAEDKQYMVYAPYAGAMNPRAYWYYARVDVHNVRCSTMDVLLRAGLVQDNGMGHNRTARITDAGRAALKEVGG